MFWKLCICMQAVTEQRLKLYLMEDVPPREFIKGTYEGVSAAENTNGGPGIVEQIFCCGGDSKRRHPLIQNDSWHDRRTQKPDSAVYCWLVPTKDGGARRRRSSVHGRE